MTKIKLSENHKRSLSGSMYIVEKLADEFERELKYKTDLSMLNLAENLSAEEEEKYMASIGLIKEYVAYMKKKYSLTPTKMVYSRVINARRTKMWQILCDTKSKRMRGYGKFPDELSKEYDADIDKLLSIISEI